jgi:hypothetical protein
VPSSTSRPGWATETSQWAKGTCPNQALSTPSRGGGRNNGSHSGAVIASELDKREFSKRRNPCLDERRAMPSSGSKGKGRPRLGQHEFPGVEREQVGVQKRVMLERIAPFGSHERLFLSETGQLSRVCRLQPARG